jgi:thiol-disulfide isomerase/thioredoxin
MSLGRAVTATSALAIALLLATARPLAGATDETGADAGATAAAPKTAEHLETPALYLEWGLDPARLPYLKDVDARKDFEAARERATAAGKFLMVTFGANWCPDCRALHRRLHAEPVSGFVADHYEIVTVDIADFDRNLDLARDLGVDLQMGIPVAVFFAPDGSVIGATNRGELEPARSYTSRQILKFLQDVVNDGRIAAPVATEMEMRAEVGVTVHRLWLYAHILLFVFWLGADLGVFLCGRAAVKPGLTPEQRLRTAELMNRIDLAPRISASLMLTVGGILTEYVGVPHPWWQMAGIVLLGPVWLALVLATYVMEGRPLGMSGARLDDAFRAVLVVAVPVSVAWSWITGRLEDAPYVAIKLLLFAALMLLGLLLRRRSRPFTEGLRRLAQGEPSEPVVAAMAASRGRAWPLIIAIWLALALAALMGIVKPGAPVEGGAVSQANAVRSPVAPLLP